MKEKNNSWKESLSPEDQAWFSEFMPEIFDMASEDAALLASSEDVSKMRELTEKLSIDLPFDEVGLEKALGIKNKEGDNNDTAFDTPVAPTNNNSVEVSQTLDETVDGVQFTPILFNDTTISRYSGNKQPPLDAPWKNGPIFGAISSDEESYAGQDESVPLEEYEDIADAEEITPAFIDDNSDGGTLSPNFDGFDTEVDAQGEPIMIGGYHRDVLEANALDDAGLTAILPIVEDKAPVAEDAPGRLPKRKKPNWKLRKRIALSIAALFAIVGLVLGGWLMHLYNQGAHLDPNPRGITAGSVVPNNDDTIDWPIIDWEYWKGVNPDIVGWVTVPGTNISHAIVQERPEEQGYYLSHDITRAWNYLGVPYLDSDCIEEGLDSRVNPIAGHNMGLPGQDGIFAEFANYNDYNYAKEHEVILLQTPKWNKKLLVQASSIIPGWESSLATEFNTNEAWRGWWNKQFSSANTKLGDSAQQYGNLYLFYTCSYFENPANERTLVFAMEPAPKTGSTETSELQKEIDAEKERSAKRAEELAKRLEEAEKIIEADRIRQENEAREKEAESQASSSAASSSQASSSQAPNNSASANSNYSSKHATGDAYAHMDGSINEWQAGFYVVGNADIAEELEAKKAGDSVTIDGKSFSILSVTEAQTGDYVEQRKAIGWDKVIIQSGDTYLICSDGSGKQYTDVVIDGQTYAFDPATGKPAVEEDDED